MSLVIDVYNVLLTTGVLPPDLAGLGVLELHDLIATVSRYRSHHVMMVCDGVQPIMPTTLDTHDDAIAMGRRSDGSGTWSRTEHGRVRILYSGHERDADSLIGQIVHYSSAPRRLTVVTRDRAVQRHAKKRGSRILGSDRFLEQLTEDWEHTSRRSSPPVLGYAVPLDDHAVRWWLRFFGLESDADGALQRTDIEIPPEMLDDKEDDTDMPPTFAGSHSASRLLSPEDKRRLKARLDEATTRRATQTGDPKPTRADDSINVDDIDMGRIMGEG